MSISEGQFATAQVAPEELEKAGSTVSLPCCVGMGKDRAAPHVKAEPRCPHRLPLPGECIAYTTCQE
eukprot:scaffold64127_cov52-Prasinocladus_malaysianus.AAC.1